VPADAAGMRGSGAAGHRLRLPPIART